MYARFAATVTLLLLLVSPVWTQPEVPATDVTKGVAGELEKMIAREVKDKQLPALSIALIDDQKVVWAKGFGFQDKAGKIPASAETVYRVGSVSKLFTDLAIMKLVEEGRLDLDAPVVKYIPDFKPAMKEGYKPITLRMLMAHRSGLVREPPVGHYFDPTKPGLIRTVASLNGVDLVYPPGEKTKYSNAAVGVVGYTLQTTVGESFEKAVRKSVLEPLGMSGSSFELTPEVKKHLADAVMWSLHGREFPAPDFELGEAPAGCMYSNVLDLARFASCLFADGKAGDKPLIKPETIAEMFKPQFAKVGEKTGFGIGFRLSELDGAKRMGHGGAIYGFATELALLPEEKLGVVVVCSRDVANPVVERIADRALKLMRAAKSKKPLPTATITEPIPVETARKLAGRYIPNPMAMNIERRGVDVWESMGRTYLLPDRGPHRLDLRHVAGGGDAPALVGDGILAVGVPIGQEGNDLHFGGRVYKRQPEEVVPPPEPPAHWAGLIGEYGWDHNVLYILERHGTLYALIEWVYLYPLIQESESVYAFPRETGLYHGEKLVFSRDAGGRATKVEAAKVVFKRRKIDGENGETFRIKPIRPMAELSKEALSDKPPTEKGEFRKPDMVDLNTLEPDIKFDIRYATDNNFLSTPFYASAKAYMQRPAVEALARVQKALKAKGYGLLIYDAYRPWYVTKMFWDATPPKLHNFVADPSKGSRHNRGCAVDLGLYDLKTGKPITIVSGYDEMTDRAFPEYLGGTSRQRWHRELLRHAMEAEGFSVYEEEWWHFDYKDWRKYPIQNLTFEQLAGK